MTHNQKGAQGINQAVLPILRRCLALSKELNNPVAGIVGYCEFLLDTSESLTAGQRLSIEEIRDFAVKIQTTLEELAAEKAALAKKIDITALESTPPSGSTATD
ncbi:MAG: hypothetical protein JSV52_07155 [Candidatus Zixiibacteriota bacterium]|nr:MAG: hypothetical protein JSV52_07155 [candidate division Zixibacteria bacterium]